MATMSAIRDNIRNNLPTGYHSTYLTNAKILEYMNDALRQVCNAHNFTWMEWEADNSTVMDNGVGQRRYALPVADTVNSVLKFKSEKTLELINSQGYRVPLKHRLKCSIEERAEFENTTAQGIPKAYDITRGEISLYPLPDHSYNGDTAWTMNLEYYGYLLPLVGGNDTNEVTDRHPEVLEFLATARCFIYGRNVDEAGYWEAKAVQQILPLMIADDDVRATAGLEEGMSPAAGQGLGDL